ncbi:MAG: nucleotidyltransferase [Deltaproteobacteria bacterium]|nr:nucleotidyltransferase [Deltaproteobacteria bacterium]
MRRNIDGTGICPSAKPNREAFYRRVLHILDRQQIPFLIGGAYMLRRCSEILRDTKDLDVFVCRRDFNRALDVLASAGYQTEFSFSHWLGKVISGNFFVDLIFSSGNGICRVDDIWFEHALPAEVLGMPVRLCPPEEMIWSKAFVMERERYDGADIAHILRACGERMDWQRLLRRFEAHWRVLLSYLILFGYIYPSDHSLIPEWVMQELLERLQSEKGNPLSRNRVCRGTLLSRIQYREDIELWGYQDARLLASGGMTPNEVARWTTLAADQDEQ